MDPWFDFVKEASERSGPAFYFERGPSPGRSSRWAISGFDPEDRTIWNRTADVALMDQALRTMRPGKPHPLHFGYLGFDAIGLFEPLLSGSTPPGCPFPLAEFWTFPKWRRVPLSGRPPKSSPEALGPLEVGRPRDASSPGRFAASVLRLKKDILDGEAFQVVLAHRREWTKRGTLLPAVDRLRRVERYAYLYYLRTDSMEIAGASPESVVEVAGGNVAISPIAGTRPRPSPRSGPGARLPLKRDPKELAEHRMLVDLARNDVGRVADVGTVRMSRLEVRVPYSRLEHLVTRVVGRLRHDRTALDALQAAFPAGTVSGAPKIRATELIRREERTWRGPYAGAVGFLHGPRDAEFALAIRTAFATRSKVYTEAGAGIVHKSDPGREWNETLVKLSAIESALQG